MFVPTDDRSSCCTKTLANVNYDCSGTEKAEPRMRQAVTAHCQSQNTMPGTDLIRQILFHKVWEIVVIHTRIKGVDTDLKKNVSK